MCETTKSLLINRTTTLEGIHVYLYKTQSPKFFDESKKKRKPLHLYHNFNYTNQQNQSQLIWRNFFCFFGSRLSQVLLLVIAYVHVLFMCFRTTSIHSGSAVFIKIIIWSPFLFHPAWCSAKKSIVQARAALWTFSASATSYSSKKEWLRDWKKMK